MGSRRRKFRACSFESLEDRRLLAGDVTARIVNGDLEIRGDNADNGITITAGATAGSVVITGINAGGAATNVNGTANGAVTLSGLTDDFKIKMRGGNDSVTITGPLSVPDDAEIEGGDGNDTFTISNLTIGDSLEMELGDGDDTATLTSVTVSDDDAEIEASRGTDNVTIINSIFEELEVEMGRGNDNLNISGTTVHDETELEGGRGSNTLTMGTGNSLADSDIDDFTTVSNTAPTVDVNTVTPINENSSATVTGTFTDPDVADMHWMVVDWDDPNNSTNSTFTLPATSSLTVNQTINSSTDNAVLTITAVNTTTGVVTYSVQHRYLDDGVAPGNNTASDNLTAAVAVSDHLNGNTDTTTVTVNNVVPTITDPADTSVNENSEVTLSTTITDPGTLDAFTATVNWGDGQASADSINLGTTAITDQVVGNTKFSWNPTTRVLTFKHTYADDNPTATVSDQKTVTVTVRDDDSSTVATQTTSVTVNNVVPTITDPADTAVNENSEVTLSTTITDAGAQDTVTATVNWGDGQSSADSINLGTTAITDQVVGNTKFSWNPTTKVLTYKHTYLDDNPTATLSDVKTVTVTVRDDDSATIATQTTLVTVNNVQPTITDPADTAVNENSEVTLSTTITDVGTQDTFTATVNWGDGQASPDSINLGTTAITDQVVGNTKFSWNPTTRVLTYKHTYVDDNPTSTVSDQKTVTVTVRDDDSANTATQTTTVTVQNVVPTITDPADTAVNENSEVTLSTTITDVGSQDTFTATVNWGDGQASADSISLGTTGITDQVIGNTKFSWNPTTRVLTYKHTYLDDNPTATASDAQTVTVTVRDDDSATVATQTTTVTVNTVVPTITDPPDTSVNEGTELTLSTTVTDPGTLDTFIATVNWGDGQTAADSINLGTTAITDQVVGDTKFSWNPTTRLLTYKHTYPAGTSSEPKTVTVTVRDDDSATTATQTTTVTVSDIIT
jgi:hypothetical protein